MSPNCSGSLEHQDQRRKKSYWKQARNMRKWRRASRIGKSESREKRKQWNKPKCGCFPAWKAIWQKMLRWRWCVWTVHLHEPILWASDGRLTRSEVITGHPLLHIQLLGASIHWETSCSALHFDQWKCYLSTFENLGPLSGKTLGMHNICDPGPQNQSWVAGVYLWQ